MMPNYMLRHHLERFTAALDHRDRVEPNGTVVGHLPIYSYEVEDLRQVFEACAFLLDEKGIPSDTYIVTREVAR